MKLPSGRLRVLLPLLVLAAGLALFGDKTPAGAAKPVATTPSRPAATAAAAAPLPRPAALATAKAAAVEPLEALLPRAELVQPALGGSMADLFASPRWSQPPPPPAPVAQVAVPIVIAPPTYRVLGKKEEDGAWELYLGREDSSFIVRAGDTLEGTWRVGKIEPPTVPMTHIQSGTVHDMPIGDSR